MHLFIIDRNVFCQMEHYWWRLVHPSQSQRSFQKLFQSLHACISKQFIYVGWADVDDGAYS